MKQPQDLRPWQTTCWSQFAGHRSRGTVPHAWLLSASPGMGLQAFAQQVVASLLCTQHVEGLACGSCRSCISHTALTHPDLYLVQPAKDRVSIGVDAFRELSSQLGMTPQAADFQVAVIDPAEIMTREAANALLKTLEEPTAQTVLLLLSEQSGRLLPTILSRCQRLHLASADKASTRQWLSSYSDNQQAVELALELSSGAPLRAAELLTDGSLVAYGHFRDQIARLGQAEFDRLAFAKSSGQNLTQFCGFYQHLLVQAQREAVQTDANPEQILAIAEIDRQLQRLRYLPGTGVRVDLAVLRLLEMHAHAIS